MIKKSYSVLTVIAIVLTVALFGCQKVTTEPKEIPVIPIYVLDVTLDKTSLILTVSDTESLMAIIQPLNADNKAVTWSSSAPGVASVDGFGKVTAVGQGTATITVTTVDIGKTATCNVTVDAFGIALNKKSLIFAEGDTEPLTVIFKPATEENRAVTWSSSEPDVAFVDGSGRVTAISAGTATITATTDDDDRMATCLVTVTTTHHRVWGLGQNLTYEHSNNVLHDWYIDQGATEIGPIPFIDNAPSCSVMAGKWANAHFPGTVQDARRYGLYAPEFLNIYNIANEWKIMNGPDDIMKELEDGKIAFLPLNMNYVRNNEGNPEWRIDKFYPDNRGNNIIVKGYKIVDDIIWFEVYDPASYGEKNSDGSLKGRDRYFRSEDVMLALDKWSFTRHVTVVSK